MNISVKIRKENFEDGEYTPEEYIKSDEVINFFEGYNWAKDSELTNECLIFTNRKKKLLCIEKYAKDVYQLYIIDFSTRYYLHKTTRNAGVIKALNKFINNQELGDEDKFVQEADRSFVDSFKERIFIYKATFLRQFEASFFWILYFLLSFCGGIAFLIKWNSFQLAALIFILFLFFWLPGLIVHLNYWFHSTKTQIQLSKGNPIFVLTKNGVSTSYSKEDIKDVIQYQSPNSRIPWTYYGFTRITFKDSNSIVLTSLLIDPFELQYKKFLPNVTIKEAIFFPWLIKNLNTSEC